VKKPAQLNPITSAAMRIWSSLGCFMDSVPSLPVKAIYIAVGIFIELNYVLKLDITNPNPKQIKGK